MHTRDQSIDKRVQSFYSTVDYVLLHPININRDLWNNVVALYLGAYAVTTEGRCEYRKQYLSLRQRFIYQPLSAWLQGKISMKEFKRQFHFVLPPFWGFFYIKLRYCKNLLLNKVK